MYLNLVSNNKNEIVWDIFSDSDESMGKVSLQNIHNCHAELRICVNNDAMGKGYAWYGVRTVLEWAFEEYNLESVYWRIEKNNNRALNFCEKHRFGRMLDVPEMLLKDGTNKDDYTWYSVLKGDEINYRESVVGCKVIKITTIPTLNAGELSFFEGKNDIPFEIKRIYYISKVPEGTKRGYHAHKNLKQILFCPYGRIQLILENENGREEIELSDPSMGVVIDKPTWREMLWLQTDSVLCVAASEYYDENDYIRNYEEFKRLCE